jgi:predicted RNase H-like HicB family nuclease
MEYTIFIIKTPEKGFVAICPLIPEAHADGLTFDECLKGMKESLGSCIKRRWQQNEEVPDESDVLKMTISVRLGLINISNN